MPDHIYAQKRANRNSVVGFQFHRSGSMWLHGVSFFFVSPFFLCRFMLHKEHWTTRTLPCMSAMCGEGDGKSDFVWIVLTDGQRSKLCALMGIFFNSLRRKMYSPWTIVQNIFYRNAIRISPISISTLSQFFSNPKFHTDWNVGHWATEEITITLGQGPNSKMSSLMIMIR